MVQGKGALMQCGGGNEHTPWGLDQRQASSPTQVNQPLRETILLSKIGMIISPTLHRTVVRIKGVVEGKAL